MTQAASHGDAVVPATLAGDAKPGSDVQPDGRVEQMDVRRQRFELQGVRLF